MNQPRGETLSEKKSIKEEEMVVKCVGSTSKAQSVGYNARLNCRSNVIFYFYE